MFISRLQNRRLSPLLAGAILGLMLGTAAGCDPGVKPEDVRTAIEFETRLLGQDAASSISKALSFGLDLDDVDHEFSARLKKMATEHSFLAYLVLVDDGGRILFHSDPEKIGMSIKRDLLGGSLPPRGVLQDVIATDGRQYFHTVVPLVGGRREFRGAVVLGVPVDIEPPAGAGNPIEGALRFEARFLGQDIGNDIARLLAFGVFLRDITDLQARCTSMVEEHPELAYVMVVDSGGVILFHSSPEQRGTVVSPDLLGGEAEPGELAQFILAREGEEHLHTVIPLRDSTAEYRGAVLLGLRSDAVELARKAHAERRQRPRPN